MKKYRLTLIFAVLFAVWVLLGPQIIEYVEQRSQGIYEGFPPGVQLEGRLFYTQGFNGIWRVDLATGDVGQWWSAPEGGFVRGISASPDGSQLAVAYAPPAEEGFQIGTTNLYLTSSHVPDLQPIFVRDNRNESYHYPVWSGEWLYYTHQQPVTENGAVTEIKVTAERISVDSGDVEIVLEGTEQLAPSPDGSQIVYLKIDIPAYKHALWIADREGSVQTKLVEAGRFDALASPRFTPDGQGVIFSASGEMETVTGRIPGVSIAQAHGLPWDIWEIALDTNTMKKVTPAVLDGPWIAWSPDGQQMAVLAAEGVFIVHNSSFYRLTEVAGEGEIAWIP